MNEFPMSTTTTTQTYYISTDGKTWTANRPTGVTGVPSGMPTNVTYIVSATCFDGSNFIAVMYKDNMVLLRSTSPTSFFSNPMHIGSFNGSTDMISKLVSGNGRYVGITLTNNVWTGTLSSGSWTKLPFGTALSDVMFSSGMFILICTDGRIYNSPDGSNWKFCDNKAPDGTYYGALYTNIGA